MTLTTKDIQDNAEAVKRHDIAMAAYEAYANAYDLISSAEDMLSSIDESISEFDTVKIEEDYTEGVLTELRTHLYNKCIDAKVHANDIEREFDISLSDPDNSI